MVLKQFAVRGEQFCHDGIEENLGRDDPHRRLIRYRPDRSELFVYTRVNLALLQAAVSLPILLLKPSSREDEVMRIDGLLTPRARRETMNFSKEFART